MLSVEVSYALSLAACCLIAAWVGWRHGAERSLGVGMALSLLAASWFQLTLGGVPVSVPTSAAIILLIAYCIHSGRQIWSPLTLLDVLIGCLALWHVVVDVFYGGEVLGTTARAYGEWILPYVAGRFAVLHRGALSQLSPWFVGVGVLIALAAVYESFTAANLWETVFHEVDDRVRRTSGQRYDLLYRAIGPLRHPIFLGVLLMLLVPWTIDLIESAEGDRKRNAAGYAGLASIIAGVVATVSRGPLLGLVVAAGFAAAVKNRIARWVILTVVVVAGGITTARFDDVLALLDASIDKEQRAVVIEVEDEAEVYTGTRNRLFVIEIYGPLVIEGGPLGYGTVAAKGFPPNIPGLPTDPRTRERLRIVDNSFINAGLRFGWIGLALFAGLFVAAICTALSLRRTASTYLYPSGPGVMLAFAGISLGVACELLTVYWDYDFGFWILFHFGMLAGLASWSRSSATSL